MDRRGTGWGNRWAAYALAAGMAAGAAAADEPSVRPEGWTAGLNAGANVTRGNAENMLYNAGALAEYRKRVHEIRLELQGNYGESTVNRGATNETDETTVQNAKGVADYRYLFTERSYGYANGMLEYDDIADVDYRLIAGPGVGRYVLKGVRQEMSVETGPAYVRQRLSGEDQDSVNLRIAERYELKLKEGVKLWESAEIMPAFDDFDNYLAAFEVGAESAMTERLSLRVVLQDTYNSQPAPDKERNDLQLVAGITVKL